MSKFHHTKGYRYWKKRVTIRGKHKCKYTNVTTDLRTHHLFNVKDFPQYKRHIKKGILISNKLHSIFHNHWMGGFRVKCTPNDFDDFILSLGHNIDLFIKNNLL